MTVSTLVRRRVLRVEMRASAVNFVVSKVLMVMARSSSSALARIGRRRAWT